MADYFLKIFHSLRNCTVAFSPALRLGGTSEQLSGLCLRSHDPHLLDPRCWQFSSAFLCRLISWESILGEPDKGRSLARSDPVLVLVLHFLCKWDGGILNYHRDARKIKAVGNAEHARKIGEECLSCQPSSFWYPLTEVHVQTQPRAETNFS